MSDDNLLSFAEAVGNDIARLNGLTSYANTRTLAADEDLNTLRTDGRYNATFNMVDWQAQNYPGNLKGRVVVDTSASIVTQVFYSRSNVSVPYVAYRFMLTSGWSPWVSIATNQDLDSIRNNNRDTGWRNISTLLPSGWQGTVVIRRDKNMVTITGTNLRPAVTGNVGLFDIPAGFRPARKTNGVGDEAGVYRPAFALNYAPFKLELRGIATAGSFLDFHISYFTSDTHPDTYPGTPM